MREEGPSKTFTHEAVESWLLNLAKTDWEPHFDKSVLSYGRDLYREGAITAIDLQSDQAIVSRKVERKVTYSVIEWSNATPSVRSSTLDELLGPAIAVAGIYEIEELVSEEHGRFPLGEEETPEEEETAEEPVPVEDPEPEKEEQQEDEEPVHSLVVELEVTVGGGLTAEPKWKLGRSSMPVYGPKAREEPKHAERDTLLQFVANAGKRDFTFEKKNGLFRLRNWKTVADFAEKALPTWEKSFRLRFKGDAKLLHKGRSELTWEIEARTAKDRGMTLRESFHLDKIRLSSPQARRIARVRGGLTFVPKHGLVRLNQDQMDDFEWWGRNRGKGARARWPRYMLFSFFARKYVQASPDGKLATWRKSVGNGSDADGKLSLPAFMRNYQKQGVNRLHSLHKLGCHGLLADEMGLGKTAQALALLQSSPAKGLPDLVVCPAAVIPVWIREVDERFSEINVRVLGKGTVFDHAQEPCLWLASYTQLRRHRSLLDKARFRYAVLDEAQLIRNPKAKVTQACIAINAEHRLALSGTPIENTPLDLWTIFRFLMPGLLGGRRDLEKSLQESPGETADLLRRQVAPFVLRRIKAEVAKELPPKLETDLPCPLTEEQRREYRILTQGARTEHGDDLRAALKRAPTHVFSLLTRLRQTSCDASLLPWRKGSPPSGGKTDLLLEKLPDLIASSSKALVFSQFTSYLAILKKLIRSRLPEVPVHELTGRTRDRGAPVQAFEEAKGAAIMLVSLKAGGLGVTLRAADYVFLMDPWWNPAAEEQAIDRAHRLGRKKPTFVYRLVARGTVEERVRQLQGRKREAFRRIIGRLEPAGALAEHFTSLRELVELRE